MMGVRMCLFECLWYGYNSVIKYTSVLRVQRVYGTKIERFRTIFIFVFKYMCILSLHILLVFDLFISRATSYGYGYTKQFAPLTLLSRIYILTQTYANYRYTINVYQACCWRFFFLSFVRFFFIITIIHRLSLKCTFDKQNNGMLNVVFRPIMKYFTIKIIWY